MSTGFMTLGTKLSSHGERKNGSNWKRKNQFFIQLSSDSVNFHNCFGPGSLSLGFSELNGIMKLPILGILYQPAKQHTKLKGISGNLYTLPETISKST